jgi:hypothetical protein
VVATRPAAGAVWFAAGLAYLLQLVAFAALVRCGSAVSCSCSAGWQGWCCASGRGLVAFWLTRDPVFPLRPALMSLVAFVFVLLLLEPCFCDGVCRRDDTEFTAAAARRAARAASSTFRR